MYNKFKYYALVKLLSLFINQIYKYIEQWAKIREKYKDQKVINL